MDKYIIAEEAYKNGYAKGYEEAVNEFAFELKEKIWQMSNEEDIYVPYPFTFVDKVAYKLMDEMNNKRCVGKCNYD